MKERRLNWIFSPKLGGGVMSQISVEIRRAFLIWFVANILGLTIPPLVLYLIPLFTALTSLLSSVLIISLPLSIAQWIALRRISPVSAWWMVSLPASILVFVLVIREIPERYWPDVNAEGLVGIFFFSMLIGLIIAVPQWLLLRRVHKKASIWLLGTVLGIGLGAGVVLTTDLVNRSGIAAYALTVLAYTIATGLTLSWLLMNIEQSREPVINPS
jgi:hypothetical protein